MEPVQQSVKEMQSGSDFVICLKKRGPKRPLRRRKAKLMAVKKKISWYVACMLAGLLLVALVACSSGNPTSEQNTSSGTGSSIAVEKGSEAPDFTFQDNSGTTRNLSDYRGHVVILNFWATWCSYCLVEMPDMQQIVEDYSEVSVLAINRGDAVDVANEASVEYGYDFVWGTDGDGTIQSLYPSNGIPYSVIIDKEGTIVEIYEGSSPSMYQYFEDAITRAL